MKMLKTAILGAVALATIGTMSAETIKVTGSTAFRKATMAGIINRLSSGGTVRAAYVASGTGLGSANQAIFTNGTDTVQLCMAGSVGGVEWVTSQQNVRTGITASDLATQAWIALPAPAVYNTWTAATVSGTTINGGSYLGTKTGVVASTYEAPAPAQVAMSDSFQSSTPFDAATAGVELQDSQGGVGIVTFVLAKGLKHPSVVQAAYDRLGNISLLQFQALASAGSVSLQFLTGNPADLGVQVVLVGRDTDSGTRLVTFAEAAYGSVNTDASQYRAYTSGNADVGTASGTLEIDHLTSAGDGKSGYSSGGHLKKVLQSTIASTASFNGSPFILVGYAGSADTPAAVQELKWNGTVYSPANAMLGNYSFWSTQHLYRLPTQAEAPAAPAAKKISATKAALADSIAAQIVNVADVSGIKLSDMQCVRYGVEGTVISPNY